MIKTTSLTQFPVDHLSNLIMPVLAFSRPNFYIYCLCSKLSHLYSHNLQLLFFCYSTYMSFCIFCFYVFMLLGTTQFLSLHYPYTVMSISVSCKLSPLPLSYNPSIAESTKSTPFLFKYNLSIVIRFLVLNSSLFQFTYCPKYVII